jgi:HK97 family phage major capsid protein
MFLKSVEEAKKEYMAGIRNRAPEGIWKLYEDTRSRYINEGTWQDKNKSNDGGTQEMSIFKDMEQRDNVLMAMTKKTMEGGESITALENRIDQMEAKANGMFINSGSSSSRADQNPEQMKAFKAFVQSGDPGYASFQNAMTEGTPADGGYTLPTVIDTKIAEIQLNLNPMRQVADVVQVQTPNFTRLANIRGTASGWVGETTARPVTNSLQFAPLVPFWGELYAMPKASQMLLDDAGFDIESFITKNIGEQFAAAEGTAFTTGDGSTKPKGFLAYPTANTADGVRAFGTMQYIPTGVAADFAATTPSDNLLDLVYSLKAAHRQGAVWMMSKSMLQKVKKFKTTTNEYLWVDGNDGGIAGAAPGLLAGYPVFENEDMATAVGAGAIVAAFGNFKNGYCIVDRMGTRLIRDNVTDKPNVNFYCTKRVGGMLTDSEAIKVLKCSVS